MTAFEILIEPAASLREPSRVLQASEITTPEFQDFLERLSHTMFAADGIGIASPQVGKNIRVIVVHLKEGPVCFMNPEIIKKSESVLNSEEGCLSVPGKSGLVKRHRRVTMKALNRHGRRVEMEASGLMATVFQHEIDHLDGILYIDKASKIIDHGTVVTL